MHRGDPTAEGSQTAKSCTDGQKSHIRRVFAGDKVARHTKVHILYHIADYVDAAEIGGKLMSLPEEVSLNTSCCK